MRSLQFVFKNTSDFYILDVTEIYTASCCNETLWLDLKNGPSKELCYLSEDDAREDYERLMEKLTGEKKEESSDNIKKAYDLFTLVTDGLGIRIYDGADKYNVRRIHLGREIGENGKSFLFARMGEGEL